MPSPPIAAGEDKRSHPNDKQKNSTSSELQQPEVKALPDSKPQITPVSKGPIVKKPSGITAGNINQGPGSIAQLGGEHNSATVNNFGPPPVKFTSSVRDIIPPMDDGSDNPTPSAFKYEKEIVVNVDAPYTPVSVGVMCESWVLVAGLPLSKCYSEYIG